MAHFAKIDESNKVIDVCVVNNSDIKNLEFPESEEVGRIFLKSNGIEGNFIQTSYNANFRGMYGSVGCFYDQQLDIFLPPSDDII